MNRLSEAISLDKNLEKRIDIRRGDAKNRDVIIACDFNNKAELLDFLSLFDDKKPYIKIGMELFYAEGPEIVKIIKSLGHKIFLDLKLHDIPNTVKKSIKVLTTLGIDMLNVHSSGGIKMMKYATDGVIEACNEYNLRKPTLIGVTQLTSTDQNMLRDELMIDADINDVVLSYAKNAHISGLDGVVCSALESNIIHGSISSDFLTITPGIRLNGDDKGDQKRVVTPRKARELGSDYIVVGRSITKANDPLLSYEKCINEFIN